MTSLPPPPSWKPRAHQKLVSRRLTAAEIKQVADYAAMRSNCAAQRRFGISYGTVARAMRIHGVKPRPPGTWKQSDLAK